MTEEPTITYSDGRQVTGQVVRLTSRRVLEVEQRDLTHLCINHQTRLQFGSTEFVIECPFTLTTNGAVHQLDPESRIGLGPLLALYPDTLAVAYVTERAALHLDFGSGATVFVPQNPHYEAWQVHDNRRSLLVCTPGSSGELVEFLLT